MLQFFSVNQVVWVALWHCFGSAGVRQVLAQVSSVFTVLDVFGKWTLSQWCLKVPLIGEPDLG